MRTEQIMCLNRGRSKGEEILFTDRSKAVFLSWFIFVIQCSSSLNVCVAYIFLFWIAIWPLCGKVTVRLAFC